jgi:predicted ATPase
MATHCHPAGLPRGVIYSFDRIPIAPVNYEDTEKLRLYRSFWEQGEIPGRG